MLNSATLVFEGKNLKFWYLPDEKMVMNKPVGSIPFEEMQAGLAVGMDLVRKGAKTWLSEVSELGVMGPEESDWLNNVFVPEIVAAGLLRLANVIPKDVFAELAMDGWNESVTAASNTFQARNFGSVEDAYAWLTS